MIWTSPRTTSRHLIYNFVKLTITLNSSQIPSPESRSLLDSNWHWSRDILYFTRSYILIPPSPLFPKRYIFPQYRTSWRKIYIFVFSIRFCLIFFPYWFFLSFFSFLPFFPLLFQLSSYFSTNVLQIIFFPPATEAGDGGLKLSGNIYPCIVLIFLVSACFLFFLYLINK